MAGSYAPIKRHGSGDLETISVINLRLKVSRPHTSKEIHVCVCVRVSTSLGQHGHLWITIYWVQQQSVREKKKSSQVKQLSNWASEASPTLGCSIEISRDICIYVYMCVCRGPKSVGGITWAKRAHAQSQY